MLLGCGNIHPDSDASPNIAAFCDKAIQAQMDKAEDSRPDRPDSGQQHLGAG